MQIQDTQPHNLLVTGSPETTEIATSDALLPNGDEVDARMEEIQQVLGHAAMHLLDRYALVAEWVHHAEAKASVFDQIVAKPKAGRPEGGISRAASELPIPGKTLLGRRKYIERAIRIDSIFEEAKSAARAAGLDNTQCSLLAISSEHSLEAQLAKVKEIAARRSVPRRKSTKPPTPQGMETGTTPESQDVMSSPELATRDETMTAEQETQLASLRTSWRLHKILRREDFEKMSLVTQRCFIRHDLLATKTIEATATSRASETSGDRGKAPDDAARADPQSPQE